MSTENSERGVVDLLIGCGRRRPLLTAVANGRARRGRRAPARVQLQPRQLTVRVLLVREAETQEHRDGVLKRQRSECSILLAVFNNVCESMKESQRSSYTPGECNK